MATPGAESAVYSLTLLKPDILVIRVDPASWYSEQALCNCPASVRVSVRPSVRAERKPPNVVRRADSRGPKNRVLMESRSLDQERGSFGAKSWPTHCKIYGLRMGERVTTR